jgi:hypothetical protein
MRSRDASRDSASPRTRLNATLCLRTTDDTERSAATSIRAFARWHHLYNDVRPQCDLRSVNQYVVHDRGRADESVQLRLIEHRRRAGRIGAVKDRLTIMPRVHQRV